MPNSKCFCAPFLALGAIFLVAGVAYSQADVSTATLKGTVTDQSGALVAGAHVKATSGERGSVHEAVTDASGVYQILSLQPGPYELRATRRYAHSAEYLAGLAGDCGFERVSVSGGPVRVEHGQDIQGSIIVLRRP